MGMNNLIQNEIPIVRSGQTILQRVSLKAPSKCILVKITDSELKIERKLNAILTFSPITFQMFQQCNK